jgi:DNA (cytosine-5)-methyltransferase 1
VKPRALDLFCGAGGATRGLQLAGFHVTGVDLAAQPRYVGDAFHQADAMTFPLEGFDFVWASPPCQFASEVTPKRHRQFHPNLIPSTRARIWGRVPYAIENVEAARKYLIDPICLCGVYFGLRTFRHRYIEASVPLGHTPRGPDGLYLPHVHDFSPLLVTTAGANSRRIGNFKSVKHAPAAYGIDWMIGRELAEAIPPAYAKYIGDQMMPHVLARMKERAA